MTTINILCPSRGRPDRFQDMVASARDTAKDPGRVMVSLLVDRDDPYLNCYVESLPARTTMLVQQDRVSCPAALNILWQRTQGDIYIAGADDILFRTPDWDRDLEYRLGQAFPDGIGFAFFNDGRDRDKAEHFAVTRDWTQAVGWFMRPEYEAFCADEDVEDIARRTGRRLWLAGITVEHMHFKYGKAPKDATYARTRVADAQGRSFTQRDNDRFVRFEADRIAAATRLRALIGARAKVAA